MEYQVLQPKASQLQMEFLQQKHLCPGLLDENQQAICCILTVEQSYDTFCAIHCLKNVQPMHSVFQLEVPGPGGPLHLTPLQEVEQHLNDTLPLQIQPAYANSPFLTDPLCYELDLLGTSPSAQTILQGTYQCPARVDFYMQQLITILQIPQQSFPVASGIGHNEFIIHWKHC